MRSAGAVLIAVSVVSAVCAWRAPLAAACSIDPPAPFAIDPALRTSDTRAPASFRELQSSTRQISATHCSGKVCTSASCGDSGSLKLSFAQPSEDASGLGYRVLWLRGKMPEEMRPVLAQIWPLTDERTIEITLSFQGVTQLDGELALVAVDRAGNESEPSPAVPVRFSGCMSYFDDSTCERSAGCSVVGGAKGGRIGLLLVAAGLVRAVRRSRKHVQPTSEL